MSFANMLLLITAVTPFDVVKTRVQTQTSTLQFKNIGQFTSRIVRQEGFGSLFRGLSAALCLVVPSATIQLTSYEWLKAKVLPKDKAWAPSAAGALARACATLLVAPFELARTRLQSSHHANQTRMQAFRNVSRGIVTGVSENGILSAWRGVGLTLVMNIPFSSIYWYSYEKLRKTYDQKFHSNGNFMESFICGGLAGTFASIVTHPVDVVKTHRQIQGDLGYSQPLQRVSVIIRTLNKQGLRVYFRGAIPRCIKITPYCAIMIGTYEAMKGLLRKKN
ncbi:solute carrier family 25 member 40 [Schizosaccharomyces japonicus yFS275]|uniref:Solute carrier family 25 member 40 n=1 Tax=Schizosaccharomyces japonicus (strain yFS275 / FY16936) TaxID=402676 RepID=B6K4T7_SCHJY|nr:solute carrier family 25 member 40 [Schizosaccharomyces japonicus yFS275]EEB08494.1 solute carrier family 25 member 40 [Schizosaccharomyces japonicus yFS275]